MQEVTIETFSQKYPIASSYVNWECDGIFFFFFYLPFNSTHKKRRGVGTYLVSLLTKTFACLF